MAVTVLPPPKPPAGVPHRTPVHPGRFLQRHFLAPLQISQSEAARRLGVSRRRLHELVQGQRAMSADTAIRCAQMFGLPVSDWLTLQARCDAYSAWRAGRAGASSGRRTA